MDLERKLLKALVVVNMVVVYILIFKVLENPLELLSLYGRSGFQVKTSVFPNPNMLGVYISTLIFIQLLFAETQKKVMYKVLIFALMIAPSLFSLVLTFSRRAWLAFVICMSIYFFIKKQNKVSIVICILLLGMLATNIDYETILNRALIIFDSSYESNSIRIENLKGTVLLMSKSWSYFLWGFGAGVTGPGPIAVSSVNQYPYSIHSYFLQLLVEFGLVGLFLYLFIICMVFFIFWKTYRIYKFYDMHMVNYLTTYMLCYLALLISSIVGMTPMTFPTNLLQWLFVGLIMRHYYIARSLIKSKGITQTNKIVDHRFLINLKRNIYEKT
jgi:O-antigen ligase